jgi:hypothetical protein
MSLPIHSSVPPLFAKRGWGSWLVGPDRRTLPPARKRQPEPLPVKGQLKQAYKYSPDFLRQFVYSTSVKPRWIGKTGSFGTSTTPARQKWYRVNPQHAQKGHCSIASARLAVERFDPSTRPSCR